MKIKIIEISVLLAIVVLLGASGDGCDGSCLDFDIQLSKLLGLSHYVICSKNPITDRYEPMEISVNIPGFTSGETYAPVTAFDCGTSMNGSAPLPHMKSAATVPAGPGNSASASEPSTRIVRPAVQGPPYRSYGWNDGYVPPRLINPNIPVPSNTTLTASSSCPVPSPDVLIVNHLHNTVTRLGTCPFSTKATIPLVSRPLQVAVAPDGTQALVTNFDNAISFINLATNSVSFTLHTDASINPAGVAITPDGKRAYVSSFNNVNPAILVIDIASHSIVTTISVGPWPQGVFITPDGSQIWVSYPFNNELDVFDTLTNTETGGRLVNSPGGIAFNSTGTRAYVASGGNPGTLVAFDTATLQRVSSYTVGTYPLDVNVMPGDQFVIVNNFGSTNVSLVDTASGKVVTSAPFKNASQSLGLVPIY